MQHDHKHISKFISLVLRHRPDKIGLHIDEEGWADTIELIQKINQQNIFIDNELPEIIVSTNDKKRFAFNDDKTKIRASQGHSIEVDLRLAATEPPAILFHGTAVQNIASIMAKGLHKQQRQHVHLSTTKETATQVGSRHGKVIVLTINAKQMSCAGYKFYLSANHVWLTDHVPVEYIQQ